jgi:hypothetical protein
MVLAENPRSCDCASISLFVISLCNHLYTRHRVTLYKSKSVRAAVNA